MVRFREKRDKQANMSKLKPSNYAAMMCATADHINFAVAHRESMLVDIGEKFKGKVMTDKLISNEYFRWCLNIESKKEMDIGNQLLLKKFNEHKMRLERWVERRRMLDSKDLP